ncbi:Bifunctional solanapyrone synthase [Lachnellula occidentalis]|uniref:Bifunctional solanapyrone synthase n=1 Tax=Lachnellula occidentalis TaxID=215460 RepID=A0A8H8RHG1_9HELO|nr:Bifunctional solanapyrone synthase [Lachnellula occidentalis]
MTSATPTAEMSTEIRARSAVDVKAACLLFSLVLPGKTSFPGSTAYQTALTSYFSAQEQSLLPACMVAPTSSLDVSVIVLALAPFHVPFAIRGGGHTLNGGAANIASGVTINLRSMNTVAVNAQKTVASIGGGAKWSEVYPVLDALKIATSGGRVSSVGVGGLSTGGGISYFSGRQGLVCDNIVNYEVVLASGLIVNVNASENSDLWLALKGGSSNFGIVTRFDIATFPQDVFYGGVVAAAYSTLNSQLAGFANLLANFDPYAALIMSISWSAAQGFFLFNNVEYTQDVENPPILQPFTQASPAVLNTMRISNLTDFANEAAEFGSASGLRNQFATTTFGGPLSMLTAVENLWNDSIATVAPISGVNWAISIQPWPQPFDTQGSGNSLGLSASNGPLVLFLLSYSWSLASDDAAITAIAQKLIADIDAATQAAGQYSPFKYLNYAAYWQNPIASYGTASLQNLKAVAQKYDPTGVFQIGSPGGFKVSTA